MDRERQPRSCLRREILIDGLQQVVVVVALVVVVGSQLGSITSSGMDQSGRAASVWLRASGLSFLWLSPALPFRLGLPLPRGRIARVRTILRLRANTARPDYTTSSPELAIGTVPRIG
ncbi:unnamed protein product [Calypogeia fissa]